MAASRRLGWIVTVVLALAAGPVLAAVDGDLQESQNILLMLGYKPGKSDGNMRPQTAQALSEFQRANKLAVTGKNDAETMAALRHLRDTKFSGSFGTPPAHAPPKKLAVEPKPQAAPVDNVNASDLAAAPGTRVLGGNSTLQSAGALPPPLFGGGASSAPANPAYPPGSFSNPGAGQAEARPFLGIVNWSWALPFLGLPVFGFLWWFGMRRQSGVVESETAELNEHRREPKLEKAAAAPARGRREPTL
jgi:peptidoglycan hydrolase-like protein with peptidoglycan-binding domain